MKNRGASTVQERGSNMDLIDMELLDLLQNGLPLESRPFQTLGKQLGITEEEVLLRTGGLRRNGYLRRLGGVFDSRKLGYVSTLCAIKVPQNRIEEVAEVINSYHGVTHNYLRKHTFNLWFTLIAPSAEKIQDVLEEIKIKVKINEIINLQAVKVFKVQTNFTMVEV